MLTIGSAQTCVEVARCSANTNFQSPCRTRHDAAVIADVEEVVLGLSFAWPVR